MSTNADSAGPIAASQDVEKRSAMQGHPGNPVDFERALEAIDTSLFAAIETQTTESDRRSLLACQGVIRSLSDPYVYLEIGSYLGGTIQPHLLDPKCGRIISIDKRPAVQADERGLDFRYENNNTERMLRNLEVLNSEAVKKIETFDGDASDVSPERFSGCVDICFIDGEHTDHAALSDFLFCLKALKENGLIVFHDAQIIYRGLSSCIEHLREKGIDYRCYPLPNTLFVVEIGTLNVAEDPRISRWLKDCSESYLFALEANDHYRRFANRRLFKLIRNFVTDLRGHNRCG